jgi:hypothetical protein
MDLRDRRLGEVVLGLGLVDEEQRDGAVAWSRSHGCAIGQAFVALELLDESMLVQALAAQAGVPMVSLAGVSPAPSVLAKVPGRLAARLGVLPIGTLDEAGQRPILFVAMSRPRDMAALHELAFSAGMRIQAAAASEEEIEAAIERLYGIDPRHRLPTGSLVDLGDGAGIEHVVRGYF